MVFDYLFVYFLIDFLFFIVGDEMITTSMKKKCFYSIDMDVRDEGSEYEGECSVFSISTDIEKKKLSDRVAPITPEVVRTLFAIFYQFLSF